MSCLCSWNRTWGPTRCLYAKEEVGFTNAAWHLGWDELVEGVNERLWKPTPQATVTNKLRLMVCLTKWGCSVEHETNVPGGRIGDGPVYESCNPYTGAHGNCTVLRYFQKQTTHQGWQSGWACDGRVVKQTSISPPQWQTLSGGTYVS